MTPTTGFVVDTSVAIKWLIDETDSDRALSLRNHDLAAPALLRIEAANVLRTLRARQALTARQAQDLFAFLQTAPVTIVEHDDALERHALDIAIDLSHPVYDCLYVALALRTGRTLVTADARFLRALAASAYAGSAVSLAEFAATHAPGGMA